MPVLTGTTAILAALAVVVAVIVAWKFVKLAFKLALIAGAGVALFFILRAAGYL